MTESLIAARQAWQALNAAQSTMERLRTYSNMTAPMRRDYHGANERAADAREVLNRVLSAGVAA